MPEIEMLELSFDERGRHLACFAARPELTLRVVLTELNGSLRLNIVDACFNTALMKTNEECARENHSVVDAEGQQRISRIVARGSERCGRIVPDTTEDAAAFKTFLTCESCPHFFDRLVIEPVR